jgi:deoxyribonuclease V
MPQALRHAWDIDLAEAKNIQLSLAKKVKQCVIKKPVRYLAGFDTAYLKVANISIAGMVVLEYPSLNVVDQFIHEQRTSFPYIPGYLSFREAPALMALIESYGKLVDTLIFDGHGIAHPRGLGIAAHIGVLCNKSSIGCAKKKLVGSYQLPENKFGATSALIYKQKVIGRVIRTKKNVKPIFVSVGHLTTLDQASVLLVNCVRKYRIPEPTRLAHLLVSLYRKKYK